MSKRILIINGPNLNLLGEREKAHYGKESLDDVKTKCKSKAEILNLRIEFVQSNVEGEIVTIIQKAKNDFDGIIINAAGYTHTSVSILDALLTLKIPIVELHISNIYSREEFRQKSLISKAATGIICGLGTNGYLLAIDAINNFLNKQNENR
jgi:3-dehydroquinate dehydratase-2